MSSIPNSYIDDIRRIVQSALNQIEHLKARWLTGVEKINDTSWEDMGLANDQGAQVTTTASVSIPNNTPTIISFDAEYWDTDEIHDNTTNPSRLICKTSGRYLIIATVRFAFGAAGNRSMQILRTDPSPSTWPIAGITRTTVTTIGTDLDLHQIVWLDLNEYVELEVHQASGAALNLVRYSQQSPIFTMHRIDG